MKVALLGPANSIHLLKIAKGLMKNGFEIFLISLPNHRCEDEDVDVNIIYLKYSGYKGYYFNAFLLKKILKEKRINILNVHYASGYGTLGRLAKFQPYILSVWGSDVYEFPNRNIICKKIIINNLKEANTIFSTSNCMAEEIKKYLKKEKNIIITPFGIDVNVFKNFNNIYTDEIVIGFLKGTNIIYGIDIFLKAFKQVVEWCKEKEIKIKTIICGNVENDNDLYRYINELTLCNNVEVLGKIPHVKMPEIINRCDIVCVPSREESFGVVAIEALACEVPCITSDAPGLKEIMYNESNMTDYVLPCREELFANKIKELILDEKKRIELGKKGRKLVEEYYDFNHNILVFCNEFNKYK